MPLTAELKWVVLEEVAEPDYYIAIVVAHKKRVLQAEQRPSSVFHEEAQAVRYAKELCVLYGVKSIRFFFMDETP